jgi:hypothetical protein
MVKTARRMTGGMALLWGCLAAPHIDAGRLQSNLEHLAEIGRDPGGGITRL